MCHRRIHDQTPERHEEEHGAEFHALCKSAGDERRRNDCEHQLIHHEGLGWNGGGVIGVWLNLNAVKEEVMESSDEAVPGSER